MKSPSFQARYRAALSLAALIGLSMFSGPPPALGGYSGAGSTQLPGLQSSTAVVSPGRGSGVAISTSGGLAYSTQRITSATALLPPVSGMYLVDIAVEGGTTPGGLALTYAPPSIAVFASPTSATDATGAIGAARVVHHPVNWLLGGTSLPSAIVVFKGGLQGAMLTYSNMASANPDISSYRAVYTTAAPTTGATSAQTCTFDAQPASAKASLVMINNATTGTATGIPTGNCQYPASGTFQQSVEALGPTSDIAVVGLSPQSPSNSITISHINVTTGGATTCTIACLTFY